MSTEEEFVLEDVETIIKQALQATFSADTVYDPEKVSAWTNTMVEQSLRGLLGQNKSFKYIVTAIIVQKNGAGLHTAAGTYWDGKKDGASAASPPPAAADTPPPPPATLTC
jgi:dynein light chain Tctex-type 1